MNVIEMKGITKTFGALKANDQVDFTLQQGEIHALLGENGAGKSTLMTVLYGLYKADGGEIWVNGNKVTIESPKDAIRLGIGMVHQHFMLVPQLTVTQNIFLGMKEAGFFLKLKTLDQKIVELNKKYGFNVKPSTPVWQLPVGVQQKVEILKVLMRNAKILILDEPTAVLTPSEVLDLFTSIKTMAKQGYSVILITHKMDEVLNYCDRVTVMRQGKVIGTTNTGDTNKNQLAAMMVGREVLLNQQKDEVQKGKILLEVKDLSVKNDKGLMAVNKISFAIKAGEILGVAGVDGNGQLELGEALVGIRPIVAGTVTIDAEEVTGARPRKLMDKGLSHIPDDRHKKGLVLPFSVTENLILGSQRSAKCCKGMFMQSDNITGNAEKLAAEFDIRPRNTSLPAKNLSGGNQQKVILARELSRDPKVIIAIQPTRGLDVGAIEFVRKKILEERANGKAVLVISTDLDEIFSLSDRIAVIYEGEFTGIVGPDVPVAEIGLLMAGAKSKVELG